MMLARLVCLLAGVGFFCISLVQAAGPATVAGPDEWVPQKVLAKAPEVQLRERPDEQSPAIHYSLHGTVLSVERAEQGWLDVTKGWVSAADVVRVEQAVEYFTAQLAEGESTFAYLGRARGWMARGDADRAHSDVSEVLRLDPHSARAVLVRGRISSEQGRDDDARADYDRAVQFDPRDPLPLSVRSFVWAGRGDYARAIADLSAAIALLPCDARLWAQRGWCHASQRDYDKALGDFSEAIRCNPRQAYSYSRRAAMHLRRQEYDQALADAESAVRLNPKMAHGFAMRGEALAAQGKLDLALRDLDESIRLDGRDPYVHNERGQVHLRKGDLDAAVLDYTQAIALKPDEPNAYLQRAGLWSMKGDQANAIVDFSEYLRLKPDAVDVWVARGYLRLKSSEDEALQDFTEALRLNPRNAAALAGQAYVWERKNDQEQALAALSAAIEIAPETAETYERRARLHTDRGEHELAIDDLTAALRIEPKDTSRLFLRSIEWCAMGETEKAIDDCRTALTYEPKNLMAYYYMALAHSRAGRPDEAIQEFDGAIKIDPDDTEIRFLRAYELFNQGKLERALAGVDEVIRSGKRVDEAYAWRGYFWMLREEWRKAIDDYCEAIRLKPGDADLLSRRASCWIELSEFEKAIQDADEALRLDPKSDEAARARERALAAKNNPSPAVEPSRAARHEGVAVTDDAGGPPLVPSYSLDLQGPAGFTLAFETAALEEFGPESPPFPHRLPMFDDATLRFKVVGRPGDAAKDIYLRLESARLSPQNAALLKNSVPSFELTRGDMDTAATGADVVKALLLAHAEGEQPRKPEFEVVTSRETVRVDELIAAAKLRGALIATLVVSTRLPAMASLLHPSRIDEALHLSLCGPHGLMLAHEPPFTGEFDKPLPVPAHFALTPGVSVRFEATGTPLRDHGRLYGLLTAGASWPAELGQPATKLKIEFSQPDLDAAAAGKAVTHVFYVAQGEEQGPPTIQRLASTAMAPGSDPVAEASRLGTIVATVKLNSQLDALPLPQIAFEPDGEIVKKMLAECVPFCLRGPDGLRLTDDRSGNGKSDSQPFPVPAHVALPPGIDVQFKLSGPPVAADEPVYVSLAVLKSWPAGAGPPKETEIVINLSKAAIDAAAEGNDVTYVIYLSNRSKHPESPRVQTLDSTQLGTQSDVFTEASRRGKIVATLKLSNDRSVLTRPAPAMRNLPR